MASAIAFGVGRVTPPDKADVMRADPHSIRSGYRLRNQWFPLTAGVVRPTFHQSFPMRWPWSGGKTVACMLEKGKLLGYPQVTLSSRSGRRIEELAVTKAMLRWLPPK